MLLSAAMIAVCVPKAMALTIKIDRIAGYYSGIGGEYNVKIVSGSIPNLGYDAKAMVNGGFETFCLETNEHISPPETVNAVIGTAAVNGGVGGGNPDPISLGTAFLYSQFATGMLLGYDYTAAGRATSADLLQKAIWCLEGEGNCGTNQFLTLAYSQFGGQSAAQADSNGAYGVFVLNTTSIPNGTNRQDMLVYVTPEPGTMLLLGSGLLAFPLSRRRSTKSK
jgi:hypothetical protein